MFSVCPASVVVLSGCFAIAADAPTSAPAAVSGSPAA
jgi:hypothetical protein